MNKPIDFSVIAVIQQRVHQIAIEHGWWDEGRNDAECIALMHSELSEALEALRHGRLMDEHCPKHENLTVELADCVIRIFDYAEARGLDLSGAMQDKIDYNEGRTHKHGNKKF